MGTVQGMTRTHQCGDMRAEHAGQEVVLMGWAQRRRDHGGVIFIDLRDRSGLVQIVFNPEVNPAAHHLAEEVRNEFVLAVRGRVEKRPEGMTNPNMPSGEIEVFISELRILNTAKNPPFYIQENVDVDESVRLRYRYLDLRRPELQRAIMMRHQVSQSIRRFLNDQGFLEIETPILMKTTPEGARDFLVPSRLSQGTFYALPQSPQIFKQLLMVSGFERYYQIARCFRDEDLRADRQPEFTQIDLEMSFVDVDDVIAVSEGLVACLYRETLNYEITLPIRRMSYAEAMEKYGSDKPDLRFGLEICNVTEALKNAEFKVFAQVIASGGSVRGINAKGYAGISRREVDELVAIAGTFGSKGLAWLQVTDEGVKSPIAKFLKEDEINQIVASMAGQPGDLLFLVADKPNACLSILGQLRLELAKRMNLLDPEALEFLWIIDFPLFEYDDESHQWIPMHHPFTAPRDEDVQYLESEPGRVRAKAYDLVLNGVELSSGSIRIYQRELQERMFAALGMSEEEYRAKFGFLIDAFEYGTPPHGGMGLGLDRLLRLMAKCETLRDVIAFPKTSSATCLMTQAPSPADEKQLKDLGIRLGHAVKK